MKDLEGKVAVVTGAASGIGLALSKRFAAEGMKVVMADIEAGALERAVKELPSGAEAITVVTDVSDAAQMDALGARTLAAFGAVHVVCNNAGVGGGGRTWTMTTKDWQWVLGVNLWGVIHGVRVFAPLLVKQNEGHIVNTASMAGTFSAPSIGAYNVSKHGVVTLSETLFHELRAERSEVGVSVLCPGFVATKIHESDRNRPSDLKEPRVAVSEAEQRTQQARQQQAAAMIAAGQSPDRVADEVLNAIRERRFYIFTHPEMLPLVEQRMRNLLAGKDPSPPFGQR
jgi:NAD(P)-dependent dehydrogenase (short-subunit alcohol dehydrogenase family)